MPQKILVTFVDSPRRFEIDWKSLPVRWNEDVDIHWELSPDSSKDAEFSTDPSRPGIEFPSMPKPSTKVWKQTLPTGNTKKWTVRDVNDSEGVRGKFGYNVYVVFGGTTFKLDPDIDNQPPPM